MENIHCKVDSSRCSNGFPRQTIDLYAECLQSQNLDSRLMDMPAHHIHAERPILQGTTVTIPCTPISSFLPYALSPSNPQWCILKKKKKKSGLIAWTCFTPIAWRTNGRKRTSARARGWWQERPEENVCGMHLNNSALQMVPQAISREREVQRHGKAQEHKGHYTRRAIQ